MADWFEDGGFVIEREPRGARRVDGPVNTTPPVGGGVPVYTPQPIQPQAGTPQATAQPGMTIGDVTRIASDPNNARLSSGGGGGQPYSDDLFLEIINRYPPTNDGARAAAAELDRVFGAGVVKLIDHPTKLDKFELPGGRVADQMYASGSPQARWNNTITLDRGSSGGGGAPGTLGGMMGGNWQAGQDPSYQFTYDEAIKALDKSNAARGISKTGGAYKALVNLGHNLASTEFSNIFGRNLSVANLGLNAAGQAAGVGSSYSGQAGNLTANQSNQNTNLVTGAGNAEAAGTVGSANAWGNTIGGLANIGGEWLQGRKRGGSPYGPDPGGG